MTHYEMFRACFPYLDTAEGAFERMADVAGGRLMEDWEGETLRGFALMRENELRLLCVAPEYQRRGVGSSLLSKAEEYAKSQGAAEIVVGGHSRLFLGAPEEAKGFFLKKGYALGERYEEMKGDLTRFSVHDFSLPVPENVRFGWYKGDLAALHQAVRAVDPDWTAYFGQDSPTFCAFADGEIASFCNAEMWENCLLSNGKNKVGAPGCVGTPPAYRRKGIGLKMVALACEELKKQGADACFIHYTGVGHWYAKLGFQTFLSWYRCKKTL